MTLLNMLEEGNKKPVQKEEISVLIGKVWANDSKNFSVAPLTTPVEGKQGEYKISEVYPLIVTEYCRISFGLNQKRDASKNQNTHWVFLNVEKDRMAEYKELLAKLGQELPEKK